MTSDHGFSPNWVSAPGDTITDILKERDLSVAEFSEQVGYSREDTLAVLEGRAAISIELAERLEEVLGAPAAFWMRRDFDYREDAARISRADRAWLEELPLTDMIRFGWLQPPRPEYEGATCLRFFGVPSVEAWRRKYARVLEMTALRTSETFDSTPASVVAWLRQGELEAGDDVGGAWDPERLEHSLPEIRKLTRVSSPNRFLPLLQGICAESGVSVVVVPAPRGCRASGAARLSDPGRALIQLSFRYRTDDHFWFTFFHEVGHLLLHADRKATPAGAGGPRWILEGEGGLGAEAEVEDEANQFAEKVLIPSDSKDELLSMRCTSDQVIRFGRRVGISAGIVVGQLQHSGRLRHNQLNRLKRRFSWEEAVSLGTV